MNVTAARAFVKYAGVVERDTLFEITEQAIRDWYAVEAQYLGLEPQLGSGEYNADWLRFFQACFEDETAAWRPPEGELASTVTWATLKSMLLKRLQGELNCTLVKSDSRTLIVQNSLDDLWSVATRIEYRNKSRHVRYSQHIYNVRNESPLNSPDSFVTIDLLGIWGVSSVMEYPALYQVDVDACIPSLIKVCEHFLNAAPSFVSGVS